MAQVKIVMKGVMKGEWCAMLNQWSANTVAAKQATQSEEHKAKEQGLQQQANDNIFYTQRILNLNRNDVPLKHQRA